jgi:hypothetical protein
LVDFSDSKVSKLFLDKGDLYKMKRLICMVFIFTMIVCVGCATVKPGPTATTKKPAAVGTASESTETKLPKSYAPTTQSNTKARHVATVFGQVTSLKTARSFNSVILKDIYAKSNFAGAVLSRCDFDVIKALVAAGWTPAVFLRSPVGTEHMRTVIGYNDPPEEWTLADPMDMGELKQLKIGYADFSKMWDDPQKTCLLVFPQYVADQLIKSTLLKYLPKEKVDSVVIRSKADSK